jgi:thioredoxin 1
MAKEINDSNFKKIISESSKPVLVDFWAPWCGPCKQLSPTIDELSNTYLDKLDVYKCNIDDNPETPSEFMVRGIPTLMIFKNGKLFDTKVGALPKNSLIEWVNNSINKN